MEEITQEIKRPRLKESHFYIKFGQLQIEDTNLEKFLRSDYFPILKRDKKGEKIINARPLVKSMSLITDNGIRLILTHNSGPELKPIEIIKSVFYLNDQDAQDINILKIKQVLG